MANFSTSKTGLEDSPNLNSSDSSQLYEGGIGYFKNYKNTCLEIFAGYGTGYGKAEDDHDELGNVMIRGTYNRIFVQPSFGWKKNRVHLILTSRISQVDYTKFIMFGTPKNITPSLYWEPAVTLKINFFKNRIYCLWQFGSALSLKTSNLEYRDDPYSYYRRINFSAGLGFRLSKMWQYLKK